jgi:uncharacterized protein Usg
MVVGMAGETAMNLEMQLKGYRLMTAEILYRMPDYPDILQTFVWQEYDIAPKFPVLRKFLDFWERSIDGKLYKVTVASVPIIWPGEMAYGSCELRLH